MTFFAWLKNQVKRDDLIGDIARDIIDDARINSLDYQTVEEWKKRVWFQTDRPEVRKAFRLARDEYNAQLTLDTWPHERLHIWDIRLRQG